MEQQAEGVAIGTDRVRTGLPLSHQAFDEEPFQECGKARGFHSGSSQCFSKRSTTRPISSGQIVRYQYVSLTCPWPRKVDNTGRRRSTSCPERYQPSKVLAANRCRKSCKRGP